MMSADFEPTTPAPAGASIAMTTPRRPRPVLGLFALLAGGLCLGGTALMSRSPAAATAPADPVAAVVVPFKMLPSNHMVVEARVNGKGPYRFIFDLGAPVTLLSNKVAEAVGAIDKKAPKSFMMGARGAGKVESMEFGDLKADDVPVIVMDHPAVKALGGLLGKPLEGIIGYTFWARYRMTIDYQAKQMTFTPVDFEVGDLMTDLPNRLAGPKRAKTIMLSPRSLWGLSVADPEDGLAAAGVSIKAVVPGSPADNAGLRPGDVLTSLDGRWTSTVADVYAAADKVEPGKTVPILILRDGAEQTLSVTPREGL